MPEKTPSVGIVVLNYNGRHLLEKYLPNLLHLSYQRYTVYVVDNGSSDGSVEYLRTIKHPRLVVIPLRKNLGYASGNNAGILKALRDGCDYIVVMNNDAYGDPQWLSEIISFMEKRENVAIAQPKLIVPSSGTYDCAGGFIDPYGRVYQRGYALREDEVPNRPVPVFYAKGAALVVKSRVLREIGLFDQDFFLYYEETDLCWRAWLGGYAVYYVPQAKVYHIGGATAGRKRNPDATFHSRKNQLAMLIKNYSLRNVFRYTVPLILRYAAYATYLAAKGMLRYSMSYLKAIVWVILNLKQIAAKRSIVQNTIRKVGDERILVIMLKPRLYDMIENYYRREGLSSPV